MEYRFNVNLMVDKEGYNILFDALDKELEERGIPAQSDRAKGSPTGLIDIVPIPKKNNAKLIEELKQVPSFVECKTVKTNNGGEIQMMIHATFNGLRLLKYRDPMAEIIFFKEKECEKKSGIQTVALTL